ncbi:MAG TPA: DUF2950 family protein [Gammaproteobacteria bacterium]|nr:DUF2950 family protein [Gammaproteobacteria bacterium]
MNSRLVALASLLGLALAACSKPEGPSTSAAVPAQASADAAHRSFATPEEAVEALVAAAEKHDTAELARLLGPGTVELLSSGDPVADRAALDAFVARYRVKHELVAGSNDLLVLTVDEDAWPLPIPLVRAGGRWQLDGAAGADELVLRRIGANELRTIDVMHGFWQAQQDYAAASHDGVPAGTYALALRSDPGKHNGLYWEVAPGEPESPAGPALAAAAAEGYGGQGANAPYHGYLYRMLRKQGAAADGGARAYVVDGKLTGGFALLAYPDSYGVSGVTSFVVNQDGVVWQRDLGDDTARLAAAIDSFDPDSSWTPIAPEG